MEKKVLTAAQKEKTLKKIYKEKLMSAWKYGAAHARKELNLSDVFDHKLDYNLEPFRRFRRSFPRGLTMALKKAGVLPL